MAKITYLQDDFDGTIDDTVASRKVILEEGTLTIDLSKDNYGKLMDALTPFTDKGEWTPRETGNDENTVIREWARKNGKEISPRGRLPKEIVSEYREYLKSRETTSQPDSQPTVEVEHVGPETDSNVESDNGSRELASASA